MGAIGCVKMKVLSGIGRESVEKPLLVPVTITAASRVSAHLYVVPTTHFFQRFWPMNSKCPWVLTWDNTVCIRREQ